MVPDGSPGRKALCSSKAEFNRTLYDEVCDQFGPDIGRLAYLMAFDGRAAVKTDEHGRYVTGWHPAKRFAEALKVSVFTIRRWWRTLREAGFLEQWRITRGLAYRLRLRTAPMFHVEHTPPATPPEPAPRPLAASLASPEPVGCVQTPRGAAEPPASSTPPQRPDTPVPAARRASGAHSARIRRASGAHAALITRSPDKQTHQTHHTEQNPSRRERWRAAVEALPDTPQGRESLLRRWGVRGRAAETLATAPGSSVAALLDVAESVLDIAARVRSVPGLIVYRARVALGLPTRGVSSIATVAVADPRLAALMQIRTARMGPH